MHFCSHCLHLKKIPTKFSSGILLNPFAAAISVMLNAGPHLLWPPYEIGQAIIFLPCGFFFLSFFLFSSPILSGRRLDVYHTSTRGVALVRI